MLDVSISYNRYKFLGYEFLTWLWFIIEKDQNKLQNSNQEPVSLSIGNRIVLENASNDNVESITIKGDDADLEEAILSLRKGAIVTELNLSLKEGDQEWRFNIKGESFNIAGLKPPETEAVENQKDIEGAVLEKVFLYDKVIQLMDSLYKDFIKLRVTNKWNTEMVPLIKAWINPEKTYKPAANTAFKNNGTT